VADFSIRTFRILNLRMFIVFVSATAYLQGGAWSGPSVTFCIFIWCEEVLNHLLEVRTSFCKKTTLQLRNKSFISILKPFTEELNMQMIGRSPACTTVKN